MWLLSTLVDIIFQFFVPAQDGRHKLRFWFTFYKDLVSTVGTLGGVSYAHVGVFNRCSCWTNWGKTGLMLPAMPHVKEILTWRIRQTYPAIIFSGIIFQLVCVPVFVFLQNRHAVRVFLQRDHGASSAGWLWKMTSNVSRVWPQSPDPGASFGAGVGVRRDRDNLIVGDGRRQRHPFHRLNSDDISLVDYTSRDKTRHSS